MLPNTKLSHYVIVVSFMASWTNEVLTTDLNDSTRDSILDQLFNDNETPNISIQEISTPDRDSISDQLFNGDGIPNISSQITTPNRSILSSDF